MEVKKQELQDFIDQHMDMTYFEMCDNTVEASVVKEILVNGRNPTAPALLGKLKPQINDCEDCERKACKDRKINSKKLLTRWSHVCNICSKSIDHF